MGCMPWSRVVGLAFLVRAAAEATRRAQPFRRAAAAAADRWPASVRGFNTARFTRTLSILSGSSVPVLEALRIAGEVVTNLPMREAVATATARVREGAPIGRSLAASKLFPPMTIHLISSGESSGQLDTMLERAAQNQERELDGLLTALVRPAGPAADRRHGRVRDRHRFCDAAPDFPDERADPLRYIFADGDVAAVCSFHERQAMIEKQEADEFDDDDDDALG